MRILVACLLLLSFGIGAWSQEPKAEPKTGKDATKEAKVEPKTNDASEGAAAYVAAPTVTKVELSNRDFGMLVAIVALLFVIVLQLSSMSAGRSSPPKPTAGSPPQPTA